MWFAGPRPGVGGHSSPARGHRVPWRVPYAIASLRRTAAVDLGALAGGGSAGAWAAEAHAPADLRRRRASTPRLVRRSVRICHVHIADSGARWR
jgi:hypothetical protein